MRGSDRSGVAALKGRFDIADFAKSRYRLETDERGWGHCPFPENHNNGDKNPSLQIDEEHQRVRCWSQGCFGEKGADIIDLVRKMETVSFQEAVNILEREPGTSANHPVKLVVTAEYDYTDEESKHLFQIQRREPGRKGRGKDFIFRAPKPDGGWIYKKAGVRLVPYRLPDSGMRTPSSSLKEKSASTLSGSLAFPPPRIHSAQESGRMNTDHTSKEYKSSCGPTTTRRDGVTWKRWHGHFGITPPRAPW